jgi:hypothetical protein
MEAAMTVPRLFARHLRHETYAQLVRHPQAREWLDTQAVRLGTDPEVIFALLHKYTAEHIQEAATLPT